MLVLGADSSCDICVDHFAGGNKAPHAIRCGHIFCLDCARSFSPPECPLCRAPYEYGTWMKLHIDISALAPASSEMDTEAQRLQTMIKENIDPETPETYIQLLLYECQIFLGEQPHSMYKDLQMACRLLSHLCDAKEKLRSQNVEMESLQERIVGLAAERVGTDEAPENVHILERQITGLVKDKSELQARLVASENLCQSLLEQVGAFQLLDTPEVEAA